jgi:hypothetical protein
MLFVDAASAADALARVRGREVSTVRPKVVFDAQGNRKVFNPWDPGYDDLP